MADVEFTSNADKIKRTTKDAINRILERWGLQAEGYAIDLVPVDTASLKQSISHSVDEREQEVVIGASNEYAAYVELGTGMYTNGGRQTPWAYVDGKGAGHFTHGMKAQPFIKPAVADHIQTYKNIASDELHNTFKL